MVSDYAGNKVIGRRITMYVHEKYPKISSDKEAIDLICDTLRSATMNYDDPHQVEEVLSTCW